jgi:cell division protein FtsB
MYDRRKSRPRQILVSLICLCALGYFAYHAVAGKRGLEARSRLIERSRQLEPEIERFEAVRARLEQEVRLLDAADPDILEEMAIELLGFARAGDRVVVFPAEAAKSRPATVPPPSR